MQPGRREVTDPHELRSLLDEAVGNEVFLFGKKISERGILERCRENFCVKTLRREFSLGEIVRVEARLEAGHPLYIYLVGSP